VGDITRILTALAGDDQNIAHELLPAVYAELRILAASKLRHERGDHALQPTALVHETYLRLFGGVEPTFENRAHFFGAAAEAMRRILIDDARRRARLRHGGGRTHLTLEDADVPVDPPSVDLLALDEALERLDATDPEKARLVKLRFFAGLTLEQSADLMGISRATASRQWTFVKAWLFHEVCAGDAGA
jgi:RNA polymerase sigma factor (TIGR02999 family)